MSLFVLASKDGWVNIMYSGLDAVGVDMQVRTLYFRHYISSNCRLLHLYTAILLLYSTLTFILQVQQ